MIPQRDDRAPGHTWTTHSDYPWGWSQFNDGREDLAAHVSGTCESGWHRDCPQLPIAGEAGPGQCSCPCHTEQGALW